MEVKKTAGLLKGMLKEQLYCMGRVFARHGVQDDVIWEVVKGFDVIYQKALWQAENSSNAGDTDPSAHKMEPHPGLLYLLEKVER